VKTQQWDECSKAKQHVKKWTYQNIEIEEMKVELRTNKSMERPV
jgi:hypothetical protein